MAFQSTALDPDHELTDEELQSFDEKGYLHVEHVFNQDEIESLRTTIDEYIDEWVSNQYGWDDGWRSRKLDPTNRETSSIIQLHDLHFLSAKFASLVQDSRLVTPAVQLVGQDLELHHSSLAAVLPHEGDPFPLHKDNVFYPHENQHYVEVLVHLDDVDREMGPVLMAEAATDQVRSTT